jgi:hypothetical protein
MSFILAKLLRLGLTHISVRNQSLQLSIDHSLETIFPQPHAILRINSLFQLKYWRYQDFFSRHATQSIYKKS